ncbi:hypothetical protein N7495_009748 [Penicillium taxi]|uniref:uncharacterized protein n=1 Tax=Penicillium taxi TaxID=168475 RepID=UPI002544E579|nr:uncharacterized protein N7495_009748 [Penicillium taxi]KAJ5885238.1 hypothetical protein N7495_009748 [Penicillium taxi]
MHFINSALALGLGLCSHLVAATGSFGIQTDDNNGCVVRGDNLNSGCSGTSTAFATLDSYSIDCSTNFQPTILQLCDGTNVDLTDAVDQGSGYYLTLWDDDWKADGYCYLSSLNVGSGCAPTTSGAPPAATSVQPVSE